MSEVRANPIPGKPHLYMRDGWWYIKAKKKQHGWRWRMAYRRIEKLNDKLRRERR